MIQVTLNIHDQATPFLARVRELVGKPTGLHTIIAGRVERLTRDYIRITGNDRHATARRLGATPTLHYIRSAHTVQGRGTPSGAELTLRGEIFARTDRDVTVTAKRTKYLTIPNTRLAYGRRAGEIPNLRFVLFKNGKAALVRTGGGPLSTTTRRVMVVHYWLKKSVLLRKDRTLLPSDGAYGSEMDAGAKDFILALDSANSVREAAGMAPQTYL